MKSNLTKIYIPIKSGFIIEQYQSIIYCKANGSYTWVHFYNRESIIISRRLRAVKKTMNETHFFRCHKFFLVKIHFIKEYCSKRKILILLNGEKIEVSCRKLKELKSRFENKLSTISY